MPSNLNALLRYKTIDKCLNNLFKKSTIEELIEKCTKALSDYKGKETSVSERTIRNDIKVMRSDALGFNAPIIFKNNEYRYSIKSYSIFNVKFDNLDLLIEVKNLLVNDFENIKSDEKYSLLRKISIITNETLPKKCYHKDLDKFDYLEKRVSFSDEQKEFNEWYKKNVSGEPIKEIIKETISLTRYDEYPKIYKVISYWSWFKTKRKVVDLKNKEYFSWEHIFNALFL